MGVENIGDMIQCEHEEYQRIYNKHKDKLRVFSSYSGGLDNMPQISTAWGLCNHRTALIASECENKLQIQDPQAWTYWKNADLVAALDREADHAAEVARLTGERDAWKTRTHERETAIRAHEVVLEECESERDAAVAAKERAEEALRWLLLRVKEDCPQQARGTTRLSMACIDAKQVLAAAQDAKPDHIPQPEKMVIKADQLVRDALVLAERLLESYQPIEGLDEGEELSMRRRIRGVVGGELLPYGGENHCCMECGFSEVMDKFRCDHDRLYCPVCGSDDVDHVLEPEHGGPEGEE